jgi:hypothetical protein
LSQAFGDVIRDWYRTSNYLVILSSQDLEAEAARLEAHPLTILMRVHEPDLDGNPLVAVAILPSDHVERMVSSLPLALKVPAMAT